MRCMTVAAQGQAVRQGELRGAADELLESELFGFEKGAFTGAIPAEARQVRVREPRHDVPGRDRRHQLSAAGQAAAGAAGRRVRAARRQSDVQVDVRLIAATNRDLETAVASGQFREDLYFRLNVVTINLPPLRERREEIPILTEHFLQKYSVQYNKPMTAVSPELSQQFLDYDWPGNVRQLENLIKRMVVLGTEAGVSRELLQPVSRCRRAAGCHSPPAPHSLGLDSTRARPERRRRVRALRRPVSALRRRVTRGPCYPRRRGERVAQGHRAGRRPARPSAN
jgi:DNA-binding NtrC family response regulator